LAQRLKLAKPDRFRSPAVEVGAFDGGMIPMKTSTCLIASLLFAFPSLGSAAETVIAVPNSGFEQKGEGWSAVQDNGMSAFIAEAAHTGKVGLRVTDGSATQGSSLASKRFPATAGKSYEVRFYGRNLKGQGIAVYLKFYDAAGKLLNTPELKNQVSVAVRRGDSEWKQFSASGAAPAMATQVEIWIHSFLKNEVTADFDDFVLVQRDA
jgi:hypothetical protein